MANVQEYLTSLKKYAPYIRNSQALQNELKRREGEGATVEQILNDSQVYAEIGEGAQDYYQPEFTAAKVAADEERGAATTTANRLQDAISKTFERRRQQDPYRRDGIVSGAADQYDTEQEVNSRKGVEEDLGTKLSFIAKRLGATNQGLQRNVGTLETTMRQQLSQAPITRAQERMQTSQPDKVLDLFQDPMAIQGIPDDLLKQILESYGYTVTA